MPCQQWEKNAHTPSRPLADHSHYSKSPKYQSVWSLKQMKTIFPINDDQINKNLLQGRQHLQTQYPCCISLKIQSGGSAILQTWRSSPVTSIETFYMQCTPSFWTTSADVGSVLPDQVTMPQIPSTIYYTLCLCRPSPQLRHKRHWTENKTKQERIEEHLYRHW